jgi:hypothetical protein
MLGFFHQEAFWDQQRKVGIDVTGGFDPVVQTALDCLPDGVAGRFEHNAPFDHLGVIRQVSLLHNVEIPLRIILRTRRNSFFRHVGYTFLRSRRDV